MGIRLTVDRVPRWIDLGDGAKIFVRPATTMLVFAARAQADALLARFKEAGEAVTALGGRIEDAPDISTPEGERAALDALFVVALAELAATDWAGVLPVEGNEQVPFDGALLSALFADEPRASRFLSKYLVTIHEVVSEGNV